MRNWFTTCVLVLSGLLVSACRMQDAVDQAENEVFAIHDQVMPKTSQILALRKRLTERVAELDSLKQTGSAVATLRTDEEREQALRIKRNLTEADSLMLLWMNQYNSDTLDKLSEEDGLRYLDTQKEQITHIKTKVDGSIQQARKFLDES
ncbi:viral A-type inclusion protein [Spirosoma montaniterrae]|uniref:Viral A-type inclusion protein n=1 Tax=Spirosoma montaniterrae TaxID=1178516 RepID=A0A1P9WX98_9BACT|nr:viral A-type inclusion protein [Spirosoma montaniterrae]AQG79991.1 viral A-type inclusion protein [Spirosoma montaniterrae]